MRLFDVVATAYKTLRKAPGNAVVVQLQTDLGEEREIELYQQPGIASGPTPGDKVASIDLGGYRVGIATHNYRVNIEVAAGETVIYSTNADGGTKQAEIKLGADGKVSISNTAADLTAVLNDLIAELKVFKTTGSPTNHVTDPGTIANLIAIEADLALLMQEAT